MTPLDREAALEWVRHQIERLNHARLEGHLGPDDLARYHDLTASERQLLAPTEPSSGRGTSRQSVSIDA
jgi:hypothetical protein